MTDSSHRVRALLPEDIRGCAEILYALPEWFGLEAANRAYVESCACRMGVRASRAQVIENDRRARASERHWTSGDRAAGL